MFDPSRVSRTISNAVSFPPVLPGFAISLNEAVDRTSGIIHGVIYMGVLRHRIESMA